MGKNIWVTGNKANGFRVKAEGAERAAGIYRTQQKAIETVLEPPRIIALN